MNNKPQQYESITPVQCTAVTSWTLTGAMFLYWILSYHADVLPGIPSITGPYIVTCKQHQHQTPTDQGEVEGKPAAGEFNLGPDKSGN